MGEVFRARDTKLNRDVAIKVLPAAFAQDAERVARFRREAQVLASLNHSNTAAIYESMRFISIRDLRSRSAEIWKALSKERELVITSNGKPIAILSAVSEETLEEALKSNRTSRAVAAVETMQRRSLCAGTDRMTGEEIEAEIAAGRKKRSRRVGYLTSSVTYSVTVKRHESSRSSSSKAIGESLQPLASEYALQGRPAS